MKYCRYPNYVLTPTMYEFLDKIRKGATDLLSPTVDDIYSDLADTTGLLDVKDKENDIRWELTDKLLNDPEIQKIDTTLKRILKKMD